MGAFMAGRWHLAALILSVVASSTCEAAPERWFYAYVNLRHATVPHSEADPAVNYGAKEFLAELDRLHAAKYTVVVLSSHFLASRFHLDPNSTDSAALDVQRHLKEIVDRAEALGIEIIPEVMPVGGSGSILSNDPNLAEGTPVRSCEYLVKLDGDRLVADVANPASIVDRGEMSGPPAELFETWNIPGDEAQWFHREDDGTLRIAAPMAAGAPTSAAFGQNDLPVKPWHQYRLRYRIRTEGLPKNGFSHYAAVQGKYDLPVPVTRVGHSIKPDQGWTDYVTLINTYESKSLSLWFGFDGFGEHGKIWIDDIVLENVGGANLLRREDDLATPERNEGLPVSVRGLDGTQYEEGADFERWDDPDVGKYGDYLHTQPPRPIRIPAAGSRIAANQRLLVDYYHAALPSASAHRVCCSLRHPKVLELFRWQVTRVNELTRPRRWMINHDEIRGLGHDPLSRGESPHKILGEHLEACLKILGEVDPDGQPILMNDMYDPYHNAVLEDGEGSYSPMVRGSFAYSWQFIPKEVAIWNWSIGESDIRQCEPQARVAGSFRHFQRRGFTQIAAGFYDQNLDDGDAVKERARRHFQLVKGTKAKVSAVCYYTNTRCTKYLEDFAAEADAVFR